ncbi:RNA polymerase factor sigma-54 [Cohnella candidum]|uniref:RNA polymerase sigma-54 factor n=1 Tax=Cohnella candidum TaxID=2674991 RepID=A0A3G3JYV7_9BACL|nr:RNA polymerase factor sigma-54 [Cohnella candidum]AYQ73425.1 RNA polymerase sigma-54 factor [Cohnella candidum]
MRAGFGLGYGMLQRQNGQMRLSPRMQQAVRILQLPSSELEEMIRDELERNPVLEVVDGSMGIGVGIGKGKPSDFDPLKNVAASPSPTLQQILEEQLNLTTGVPALLRRMVRYLIGNVDSNGYLAISLEQAAIDVKAKSALAEAALEVLQSFEPTGVGARNLAECLLLQANSRPDCPPLVFLLIRSHLQEIAELNPAEIARRLRLNPRELGDAIEIIRSFHPRPGASFDSAVTSYIVPDIRIELIGKEVAVSVLEGAAPRLYIREDYRSMAKEAEGAPETSAFLSPQLHSAAFLIRCVERRRQTLTRVAGAIAEEQAAFIRFGPARLKPLSRRQLADRLGLHESTVSRATAGKFALTPHGVFELGYFFPIGYGQGNDDTASAESVKEKIRHYVRGETAKKPLSDRQLAELLEREGIPVARRTVAKYREELGIPSSVKRKPVF